MNMKNYSCVIEDFLSANPTWSGESWVYIESIPVASREDALALRKELDKLDLSAFKEWTGYDCFLETDLNTEDGLFVQIWLSVDTPVFVAPE